MKTIIIAYMLARSIGLSVDPSPHVLDLIEKGWQPYGSIGCTEISCYQPMVKTREVQE